MIRQSDINTLCICNVCVFLMPYGKSGIKLIRTPVLVRSGICGRVFHDASPCFTIQPSALDLKLSFLPIRAQTITLTRKVNRKT